MKGSLHRLIISHSPETWVQTARRLKKMLRRRKLSQQQKSGGLTLTGLEQQLKQTGIQAGDSLLVHSSLSKIGYIEGGATTLIRALLNVLGQHGTLLMPSFPASGRNKDYLESGYTFDVRLTPSAMGTVTEVFRTMPGVIRSLHPTDPVCALGPLAGYYTGSHFGQSTPYNAQSPFRKLAEKRGKILMLGTTLNGAGTSLHCLEDAVDFTYPVYEDKIYEVVVIDEKGDKRTMCTKVHNPQWSAKRNCDALKPMFEKEGVLKNVRVGDASSMLIDAHGMLEVMIRKYNESGITMYTPFGIKKTKA